ncbi:MAG TPA: hypothetical protein ENK43_01995 [Planctomycetes bacterium]|nr:hypothetical protein [Planctomycetota bacterium]
MNEDFRLAWSIRRDAPKGHKTFRSRFSEALELALEHAPEARGLGLDFEKWAYGVAHAAAESLLGAFPARGTTSPMDAHVARIIAHRDFALAVLLVEGMPGAWGLFRDRFGPYLDGLFLRAGLGRIQRAKKVEELVLELRTPAAKDLPPPIAEYRGTTDLNSWLYAFLRLRMDSGETSSPEARRARMNTRVHPVVSISSSMGEGRRLPAEDDGGALARVLDRARSVWEKLGEADRRLLRMASMGMRPPEILETLQGASTSQSGRAQGDLVERHAQLCHDFFKRIRQGVAESAGLPPDEADDRIREVFLGTIETRLVGIWEPVEEETP